MEIGLGSGLEPQENDELEEFDLGLDIGEPEETTPRPARVARRGRSIGPMSEADISSEIGRDAPMTRDIEDDLMDSRMEDVFFDAPKGPESEAGRLEEDLRLGFGDEDDTGIGFGDMGLGTEEQEGDLTLLGPQAEEERRSMGPVSLAGAETPRAPLIRPARSERADSSPLSSVRSSVDRDLEGDLRSHGDLLNLPLLDDTLRPLSEEAEEEPEKAIHHQRAVRGRRVMIDEVTEIRAKQIKAQQEDRSRILKEPSFLPRDPTLLALLSLQRSRGFAQNVFYPKNIAPELRSLLSPEFVRRMAELKRKRGAEDEEIVAQETRSPSKQPRLLDFDEEDEMLPMAKEDQEGSGDEGGAGDDMFMLPDRDEPVRIGEEEEEEEMILPVDITGKLLPPNRYICLLRPGLIVAVEPMTPGVHAGDEEQPFTPYPEEESYMPPPSTQPISKQTQAAVHLLREQFSEPIGKKSVKFQDLLPLATTARTDATKMFFEVLVLATKDAISVKQPEGFGHIVIKGKKALWGQWAEERDEQQVAEEEEKEKELELQRAKEGEGVRELVVGVGRGR